MYCTHVTGTGTRNHFYRPQTKFAKVMFLHVSVILPTGGGCLVPGGAWSRGWGLVPGGVETAPRDGCCCGRCASYWNAFLFSIVPIPVPVPSHAVCMSH